MDDLFYIISSMMVIAVVVVVALNFNSLASPVLLGLTPNNTLEHNVTQTAFTSAGTTLTQTFDSGFAVLFILMFASSMILGSLLPTNPLFFIPFVFIMAILVSVTALVSEMWNSMIANPSMAAAAAQLTYIPFMMGNLSVITTILGFALSIVIYVSYKR